VEDEKGLIHAVYDRERNKAKEILMARFTEDDILKGACSSNNSVLKETINKIT
jgi:hypothetical protein